MGNRPAATIVSNASSNEQRSRRATELEFDRQLVQHAETDLLAVVLPLSSPVKFLLPVMTVKILALSGSARRDSLNQKLLEIAACGARDSGASVTSISLADYPLPLYDGDLEAEQGSPDNAKALQRLFAEHDGLLVASPEHNGGYTALLKNAVDWISRSTVTGESGVFLFSRMVSAVISASPGPLGGLRSALGFRGVLEKLGSTVIPQSFSLGTAHKAFAGSDLLDPKMATDVRSVGAALAGMTKRLSD